MLAFALKFEQMDGLNTALPIGHRRFRKTGTDPESVAVLSFFIPGAGDYMDGYVCHLLR